MTTTRSAVSDTTPKSCVIREHSHASVVAQAAQQVKDLRLDGHVQGRGGLVGDQQLRVAGQRHGDHDALAHAARQSGAGSRRCAFRVQGCPPCAAGRWRVRAPPSCRRFSCVRMASTIWLPRSRYTGLSDVIGLLEDHGHVVAAQLPVVLFGKPHQVLAFELHLARGHVSRLAQKAHDGQAGHRLAGTRSRPRWPGSRPHPRRSSRLRRHGRCRA